MVNNFVIGLRIKQVREEKGFSQEELAKALGMNKSTIQRYESAQITKIKLPVIDAIAQKLDVNPEWLSNKVDVRESYFRKSEKNNIGQVDANNNDVILNDKPVVTNSKLSARQKRIVELFEDLTEPQQDNIIGRAELLVEQNEESRKKEEVV